MSPPATDKAPPAVRVAHMTAIEQSVREELEALAERVPLRRADDGVGWTEAWGVRAFDSRWVLEAVCAVHATVTVEVEVGDIVPDSVSMDIEVGDGDLSCTVTATASLVSIEDGRAVYDLEAM